ncbi:hypothetical protein [Methylobacterium sp. GC_Met_2]|uniref:hypothetical protein n=1 Tax=Methylobacterium sp. GC_Met_2 TaxID=2937376 RepID=UPI00226B11F7|nr:hypothetical protein [Methylobacterium sp. GC_Met_2]
MSAPASRRGLLLGLATLPLTGGAAVAGPTDLARACRWAADHWLGMHGRCCAEEWDDNKLDAEMDLYDAVLQRALVEPSASLDEVAAKAQLCLVDFEAQLFPLLKRAENDEPGDGDRMVLTVLKEVIKLCA